MVAHVTYLVFCSDVFVIVAVCICDISRGVCIVRQYEYDFNIFARNTKLVYVQIHTNTVIYYVYKNTNLVLIYFLYVDK